MKKLFEQVTDKERRKILEMYQEDKNGLLEQVVRKTVSDTTSTNVKPVVQQDVPFSVKVKDKSCLSSYGFKFEKADPTYVHPVTKQKDRDVYEKDDFKAGGVTYKHARVLANGFVTYPDYKFNAYLTGDQTRTEAQCYCENGKLKLAVFSPKKVFPGDYGAF